MEPNKAKYLIIKTEEPGGVFSGTRTLPLMVINVYPNGGHEEFRPAFDKYIKNAEYFEENGSITIKGEECTFLLNVQKEYFPDKFFVCNEKKKNGKLNTPESAASLVSVFYKEVFNPKPSDMKLGYESKFKKFFGKKSYYVDATPESISAFRFIEQESIKKDEGGYYRGTWYQSTLNKPKPFEIKTNAYRLTIHP